MNSRVGNLEKLLYNVVNMIIYFYWK